LSIWLLLAIPTALGGSLTGVFVHPPNQGEAGWFIVLLTLPTWGCCCYSAVMWRHRRIVKRTSVAT
jgi:hypothetical protein